MNDIPRPVVIVYSMSYALYDQQAQPRLCAQLYGCEVTYPFRGYEWLSTPTRITECGDEQVATWVRKRLALQCYWLLSSVLF